MSRDTTAKALWGSPPPKDRLGVAGKRPLRRAKSMGGTSDFMSDGLEKINVHETGTTKN
jgi:hypothetical protein